MTNCLITLPLATEMVNITLYQLDYSLTRQLTKDSGTFINKITFLESHDNCVIRITTQDKGSFQVLLDKDQDTDATVSEWKTGLGLI
jgi:hypothetical protein